LRIQKEEAARKTSSGIFFAVVLILGVLALGYWALASGWIDTPGNVAAPTPVSVGDLEKNIIESQNNTKDLSATMIYNMSFAGQSINYRSTLLYKYPDMSRTEVIEPEKMAGTVTVTDGKTAWAYDPGINQVTRTNISAERPRIDNTRAIRELFNTSDASYEGTDTVNGRSMYVLKLTPKEKTTISRMKLWIDRENYFIIRMYWYDLKNEPFYTVEYRDVKINSGIPDSAFEFKVPQGAEVISVPDINVSMHVNQTANRTVNPVGNRTGNQT